MAVNVYNIAKTNIFFKKRKEIVINSSLTMPTIISAKKCSIHYYMCMSKIPDGLMTCYEPMGSKSLAYRATHTEIRKDFFQNQAMDPVGCSAYKYKSE